MLFYQRWVVATLSMFKEILKQLNVWQIKSLTKRLNPLGQRQIRVLRGLQTQRNTAYKVNVFFLLLKKQE